MTINIGIPQMRLAWLFLSCCFIGAASSDKYRFILIPYFHNQIERL